MFILSHGGYRVCKFVWSFISGVWSFKGSTALPRFKGSWVLPMVRINDQDLFWLKILNNIQNFSRIFSPWTYSVFLPLNVWEHGILVLLVFGDITLYFIRTRGTSCPWPLGIAHPLGLFHTLRLVVDITGFWTTYTSLACTWTVWRFGYHQDQEKFAYKFLNWQRG